MAQALMAQLEIDMGNEPRPLCQILKSNFGLQFLSHPSRIYQNAQFQGIVISKPYRGELGVLNSLDSLLVLFL